jgi:hypothetical protein
VVVPNGTVFGDGVSARIKEELLKEFNLDGKNPAAKEDIIHIESRGNREILRAYP